MYHISGCVENQTIHKTWTQSITNQSIQVTFKLLNNIKLPKTNLCSTFKTLILLLIYSDRRLKNQLINS